VIICGQNEKDVDEIDADFVKGVKFRYVKNMTQVLDHALE
jgi:ATP-dependent Lon protease